MNFQKKGTRLMMVLVFLLLGACAGKSKYQRELLSAPEIYSSGLVNPFGDSNPMAEAPYRGILYATGRAPASEEDDEMYYTDKLGRVVRLGLGDVKVGDRGISWEEARRISILKDRDDDYPLSVSSVEEFGLLDRSYNLFMDPALKEEKPHTAAEKFAKMVNDKLEISKKKDIYMFVHGYNTNFEDPLLVATELWHYLGYDGVFIAYSWPATDSGTAYLGDTEKAKWASRNLRLFIEYLSEETDAENIHIVGYSMGTRVTTWAVTDLALIHSGKTHKKIRKKVRVGNVILIGSDLSLYAFSNFLNDGLLNIPKSFTIYTSESDMALGASYWLFDRLRLGQITQKEGLQAQGKEFLQRNPNLRFIDVTEAADATEGKGHSYFRDSPWVSSDLLMTFMYDLPPEKRGLYQSSESPVWQFPPDYISRLRESLGKTNPAFGSENNNQ